MSKSILNEIHCAVENGAKLYVRRNYYGITRMKVVRGPFGLNTKRFNFASHELYQVYSYLKAKKAAA